METNKTLLLCKTPLQAAILLKLIEAKTISNYDLLYLTNNDTLKDSNYFKKLSLKADYSIYINNKKTIKRMNSVKELLSILNLDIRFISNKYNSIFLASFDNILFRFIIKSNKLATINTFDDGTANITPTSYYYEKKTDIKNKLLNFVFAIPSTQYTRMAISKHFTLYENFDNIVKKEKLNFISLFDESSNSEILNDTVVFFIGQPFEEYLELADIKRLKKWLESNKIDYYIQHPREKQQLIESINTINSTELLAEEIILEKAENYKVQIVAGYSTVLFNINAPNIDKIYLSLSQGDSEKDRCRLIQKTKSKIIRV